MSIILENRRVFDYITQKDELVTEGRKISGEIDKLEVKIKRFEIMEKRVTGKVIPPKELTDRGDDLVKQATKMEQEIEEIVQKINDFKLEAVPKEMKEKHLALLKDREVLERDRNKIALKVQKVKDRLIPIIQKEVKPLLGEYDDIETAKAKDGKVEISTFNRLEEFKKTFKK